MDFDSCLKASLLASYSADGNPVAAGSLSGYYSVLRFESSSLSITKQFTTHHKYSVQEIV